ncbi:MAG: hypothetical protein BWY82_03000 [Verrucomicrobia bacterium ADurb.Bin474]|nr:MAG: hypothetical protein BWY82_03000 [Verrucomicrobia bacterium ADurb.Bin474]
MGFPADVGPCQLISSRRSWRQRRVFEFFLRIHEVFQRNRISESHHGLIQRILGDAHECLIVALKIAFDPDRALHQVRDIDIIGLLFNLSAFRFATSNIHDPKQRNPSGPRSFGFL